MTARPSPRPRVRRVIEYRPDKAIVATVISAAGTLCASLGAAWLDGHLTGAEVLFAISTTLGVAGGTGVGVYAKRNRPKNDSGADDALSDDPDELADTSSA